MGRRRKISINKRNKRNFSNEKKPSSRKLMIDMRRLSSFKFKLKEALTSVEGCNTIFANILSKSINLGIEDTLRYVEAQVEEGNLKTEKSDEIVNLLDRYNKYR